MARAGLCLRGQGWGRGQGPPAHGRGLLETPGGAAEADGDGGSRRIQVSTDTRAAGARLRCHVGLERWGGLWAAWGPPPLGVVGWGAVAGWGDAQRGGVPEQHRPLARR